MLFLYFCTITIYNVMVQGCFIVKYVLTSTQLIEISQYDSDLENGFHKIMIFPTDDTRDFYFCNDYLKHFLHRAINLNYPTTFFFFL